MILNLHETKEWLRVDGDDQDIVITTLIGAAETYLKNATGRTYGETNHLAKLFCMVLVADWFENRELIGSAPSDKMRLTVQSMLTQLQYAGEDGA